MLTKTTKLALGQHTAGIYADMSIDGPEIGTLVAIIDRAKNLPNRKTMGKQNPYCAARLGKEAKKTDTDMRGGQTPKWDQELRFTVHSSPDYYQLKLSVFNDDKKTDLIGETWVDLKNVIVPGGGQNDLWHNLQCKGKYAGELRMELTYYDTRPKDEAVIERRKEAAAAEKAERKGTVVPDTPQPTSRKTKGPRRRPLPVDPTGSSSSSARQSQQPPKQPAQPVQAPPELNAPTRPQQIPSKAPHASQAQPATAQHAPVPKSARRYETPDDLHKQWEEPAPTQPQITYPSHHPHQPQQPYQGDYENAYNQQPSHPEHHDQQHQVDNRYASQEPVAHQNHHNPQMDNHYSQEPVHRPQQQLIDNHYSQEPTHRPQQQQILDNHYSQEPAHRPQQQQIIDNHYVNDPGVHHSQQQQTDNHYSQALVAVNYPRNSYETPPRKAPRQSVGSDSRHSGQYSYPPVSRGSPYGTPDAYNRHASPETNQLQLTHSPSNHPGAHHHYNPSMSRKDVFQESPLRNTMKQLDYHRPVSSHSHSHSMSHGHGHMQPQVHEADEEHDLPPPPPIHRDGLGKQPPPPAQPEPEPAPVMDLQLMHRSQPIPMPQPLNLSGSRNSHRSTGEIHQDYVAYSPNHAARGYSAPPNPNEQIYSTSPTPSYHSSVQPQEPVQAPEQPTTSTGESIPSALIAGYDHQDVQPDLSLVRRGSGISMHLNHVEEPPAQVIPDNRIARRQSYVPPQPTRASPSPILERKSVSPDPRQVPARKSVSPHPRPVADPDSLSGIPFGPDSYDSLNPTAALSSAALQPSSPYETPAEAMEAARQHEVEKLRGLGPIIGNDGRVIDPSDHLPLDTWAPEPERKTKKPEVVVRFKHTSHTNTVGPRVTARDRSRTSISSARHSYQPSSSQSNNSTPPARPPKRITYIPSSSSPSSGSTTTATSILDRPSSSSRQTGSNALRERENFSSSYSPPANIMTPPHYRARQAQAQAQARTHGRSPSPSPSTRPLHSHSSSHSGISKYYQKSGPPIPAKVPIHPGSQNYPSDIYSGAGGRAGGDLDALSEEMKRIDIGLGKSSPGAVVRKSRQSYVENYDYEQ
ncbi:C2 domain-containing protein c [Arthroderma uncinatum]|uniref:C2 domain-containing protein c n=1 Tax=Arthroderma uncinatum TaxID=74035 RepID=UPI00144ACC55|nr:C2 domain-containing protein c [Arthroderma uncinatum]KAF3479918.1 C2 domain-containing protein c [Arthroderma uncinatum]